MFVTKEEHIIHQTFQLIKIALLDAKKQEDIRENVVILDQLLLQMEEWQNKEEAY